MGVIESSRRPFTPVPLTHPLIHSLSRARSLPLPQGGVRWLIPGLGLEDVPTWRGVAAPELGRAHLPGCELSAPPLLSSIQQVRSGHHLCLQFCASPSGSYVSALVCVKGAFWGAAQPSDGDTGHHRAGGRRRCPPECTWASRPHAPQASHQPHESGDALLCLSCLCLVSLSLSHCLVQRGTQRQDLRSGPSGSEPLSPLRALLSSSSRGLSPSSPSSPVALSPGHHVGQTGQLCALLEALEPRPFCIGTAAHLH